MAFQSIPFIVFLAVSATLYYFVPARWRAALLALASFFFYLFWSIPYTVVLLAVTIAVFYAAKQSETALNEIKKAQIVRWSVGALFLFLCFFKYGSLLKEYVPYFFLHISSVLLLPLGISYYTFKLISYLVDVYAGKRPAENSFIAFAAYVSFFPQIVAGPIQRAVDFLPQISLAKKPTAHQIASSLGLILFGLFKKLVIADPLSLIVTPAYADPESFFGFELLMVSYLFAIQLYADFSAITDIARGSARLFGIHTPKNFENPFYARTIQEFWKRWHMTLTSWMRDYVFLPLRMVFRYRGVIGLAISIFINMVIIGIWHGANVIFLWFGIIHGVYMVLSATTLTMRNNLFNTYKITRALRVVWQPVITFTFVSLSLIFFRAENMQQATSMLSGIFSSSLFTLNIEHLLASTITNLDERRILFVGLAIGIMEAIHIIKERERLYVLIRSLPAARWTLYYIMILMILMSTSQESSQPFIYFQF